MVGGFLGDFVKGRLNGDYSPAVERGIRLHRAVDAFTDSHPIVRRSVRRFEPPFRRYAPIMIDVIYDRLLAEFWTCYHGKSIDQFCDVVFAALDDNRNLLPDRARRVADAMMASRSMAQYHRDNFVVGAFENISHRLKRPNPLATGFDEFARHRNELSDDFAIFFPDLLGFCTRWQQEN